MNAQWVFMHTFTHLSLILPSSPPPCFVSSPFRFIPVMKKDGQYVLLTEEQYNTLKGEGKIVGRDFVVDYQVGRLPSASSPLAHGGSRTASPTDVERFRSSYLSVFSESYLELSLF